MTQLENTLRDALMPRYRLGHELGRGAMAAVYLARDEDTGATVAIKAVRPELTAVLGPDRFHREIAILKRLRHPGILPLLDSGDAGRILYLVMPWVDGENLRSRLLREGQLSLSATLAVARDIAAALDYAHREQVIHRDIKPENILIEGNRALVCDFGLARAVDRAAVEAISSSGLVLGTPAYMSPEQAVGERDLGAASDIYSLGCVVFEMLTGEPPFTGASPQAIIARQVATAPRAIRPVRPDIGPAVEAAVLQALEKEPGRRPATAGAFMSRLETAAGSARP
jgi:serine/threonine-protein kinase